MTLIEDVYNPDFLNTFTNVEPINKGWSEDKKYCVTNSDGVKYLLRITPIERYETRKALFAMLEQVAALGIPMCLPVKFGTCTDGVYSLQSWIDGEDLETVLSLLPETEQYVLGLKSGEIIRKMHSIPAPDSQEEWAARFNRKTDTKIQKYHECGLRFDGDTYVIDYIEQSRRLLENRPQCFQHGDYHVGNMMIENGELKIIDFDRYDFGDPWEEFNRIVWCAAASPHFATGQLRGYFGGEPPLEFFKLLAFYISSNTLSSIYWAIPFGQSDLDTMMKQSQDVLRWYENMQNPIPSWYLRGYEVWDVLDAEGNKTGRYHERGKPMNAGDCHLIVHVWIMNNNGEFLIQKRPECKWETVGGCAISGDDGLSAALRETNEELGVNLIPKNGQLFKQYSEPHINDDGTAFFDIWIFRQDVDVSTVVLQPDETCDAMWASKEKIKQMIDDNTFISEGYPYLDELFYFCDKPFWEIGYHNKTASTFKKGPTNDILEFYINFKPNSIILDVGCGEGRNSIFLTEQGHKVDAFDLSEAGIEKAKAIAVEKGLNVNFFVCDIADFIFDKEFDVIISHGVLHLPEKNVRDNLIYEAQKHTILGGYNVISVFTNRLPATPDNVPFTKSLFDVGELLAKYEGWTILSHEENIFHDSHPGGVSHEHASERIIAQKR